MGYIGATEILLILMVFAIGMALPAIALIDILKSRFEGNDAIIMVLIVIFIPIIGPILYFTLGAARKIKQ